LSKKIIKIAALVVAVAAAIPTGGGSLLAVGLGISSGMASLIAVGVSVGASLLTKPKTPKIGTANEDRLNVSINVRAPRVMAFGKTALATDLRDQEFSGAGKEYLHRFLVNAAHRINAHTEIWFDDQLAWTAAGGVQAPYTGYLTVTPIAEGAPGNAINIGPRMGSSRRFTGCAYVYLRFKLTGNSKKTESPFAQQVPTRMTIVGEGARCYDVRQDGTRGGTGAHRANDQSTWTWGTHARNPACQLATWLLGWRIQNPQSLTWKLSVGAGIPADRIDWASFLEAANLCDEPVTLIGAGTEPRYRCDGLVDEDDGPSAIVDAFKASMNADLDDQDGLLRLTVFHNDLATPDADFTEADIQGDFVWLQTPPLNDSYNVVRGSYVEPAALYQPTPYRDATVASPDGLERLHPADFGLVQSRSQAERLAKQRLQRQQYGGEFRATFLASGWKVQKNSVVRLSFAPEGWVNKLFRVAETEVRQDGLVPMVLREEHAQIYAWAAEESPAVQIAAPTLYLPGDAPIPQFLGTVQEGATVGAVLGDNLKAEGGATVLPPGEVRNQTINLSASGALTYNPGTGPVALGAVTPGGIGAYRSFLTSSSFVLNAYAAGGSVDYSPATGQFKVFSGAADVSASFALSTQSNPQALTIGYVGQTFSVTAGFDEDNATAVIRATGSGAYAGVVFDQTITLSKLKGGYEIVAALPGTNLFEGRTVYLNTDGKLYRYHSGAWTSATAAADVTGQLSNAQIADLAAAKITGQFIDTQVASNAITTSKMVLAAGNLVANGDFATGSLKNWRPWDQPAQIGAIAIGSGKYAMLFTHPGGAATNISAFAADKAWADAGADQDGLLVEPGKEYRVAFRLAKGGTYAGTSFVVSAYFGPYNGGALGSVLVRDITPAEMTAGYTQYTGTFVAPAGATRCWLFFWSQGMTAGQLYLTDVFCNQKASADLIVDGAVTAQKVGAGEVTGDKVASNVITTQHLSVATLTDNLVPNGQLLDGLTGWRSRDNNDVGSNSIRTHPNWLTVGSNGIVLDKSLVGGGIAAQCKAFPVQPGRKYSVRFQLYGASTTAGGLYTRVWSNSARDGDGLGYVSTGTQTDLTTAAPVAAGYVQYEFTWTAPAGHFWASFGIYNWVNGPLWMHLTNVEIREVKEAVHIGDGAVIANKIGAGAVTAAKVNVTDLSAISANLGTITAGFMQSPSGNTQIDLNNARITFNNGTYMKVTGIGFGTAGQFLEWYGPTMSIGLCSESNAKYFLKTNGELFFGGATASSDYVSKGINSGNMDVGAPATGAYFPVTASALRVFIPIGGAGNVALTTADLLGVSWGAGDINVSYKWQYSADNSTWSDVGTAVTASMGAGSAGTQMPALSATKTGLSAGAAAFFRVVLMVNSYTGTGNRTFTGSCAAQAT